MLTKSDSAEEDAGSQTSTVDRVVTNSQSSRSYSRSLSHISESSADGVVLTDRSAGESGEVMSLASGLSINDIEMEMPSRTPELPSSAVTDTDLSPRRLADVEEADKVTDQHRNGKKQDTWSPVLTSTSHRSEGVDPNSPLHLNTLNTLPESGDVMYVACRVSVEEDLSGPGADCLSREDDGVVDNWLEDALGAVVSSLDDYRGQFPELQLLEQELKLLQVTLKVRIEHV